ncbi:hypothetical protein EWM64_g7750 [Hericium alpestre]|uniref:Uncharacterized protein n=1 Tax=Hericium alpestre TaxID=135208 RepID=A0A4Y9ZR02_9AGAM|nr:hypothetical protein EWM64_g7750 [Hericium alpestre]
MQRDSGRLPSYRFSYLYRYHPYPYTSRPVIERISVRTRCDYCRFFIGFGANTRFTQRLVNDDRSDIMRWSGPTSQLPPGGLPCPEASGALDTKAASGPGQVAPLNGLESDGVMDVDEQPQSPETREDTTAGDRAQVHQSPSV